MAKDEYESLLDKSSDILSKSNISEERLKIPEPNIIREGKVTIVRNFMDMVDMINRDPKHIMKYLMKEFGIGLNLDGKRLIINKKVTLEEFTQKIEQYLNVFVRCYECNSPDTEIKKVGRTNVIECKACGAQHPINMSRELTGNEADLEEGKKYVVQISEIGRSGEGRTTYRGYHIFVPGVKKGESVRILVKKIKDGTAIGEVIERINKQ